MNILLLLGVVNVVGIAAERLNLEFEKNLGSWKILLVKEVIPLGHVCLGS